MFLAQILRNLENNMLQGPLPQALNRESLEVRWSNQFIFLYNSYLPVFSLHSPFLPPIFRTSGNLCLSFSLTCNDNSSNSSLQTPQVTVFTPRKRKSHSHLAILLGAMGGAILALFAIAFSALLYIKRKRGQTTYLPSMTSFSFIHNMLKQFQIYSPIRKNCKFFRIRSRHADLGFSKNFHLQGDQSNYKQLQRGDRPW